MSVADIRFCLIEDSDNTNSRNRWHTLFFSGSDARLAQDRTKIYLALACWRDFFFVLGGIVGLTTKFCFVGLSAVFPWFFLSFKYEGTKGLCLISFVKYFKNLIHGAENLTRSDLIAVTNDFRILVVTLFLHCLNIYFKCMCMCTCYLLYVIDSPSFFTSVRKGTNDTRSWVSEIESLLAVDDSFLATSITCFTYFCFLRIFPLFWCLCVVYTSLDHIRPNIYNYAPLAVPHLCSSRVKSSIYSIASHAFWKYYSC